MGACKHMLWCLCKGERAFCGDSFSPSTMCVLGMKFRLYLATNTSICVAISTPLSFLYLIKRHHMNEFLL